MSVPAGTYTAAVLGGGPVGLAAALALHARGADVLMIDSEGAHPAAQDPRALALSWGTRLILERLGAWQHVEDAQPILNIHVSQRGGLARAELTAEAVGLPALGYVTGYAMLVNALRARVAELGIERQSVATPPDVRDAGACVEIVKEDAGVSSLVATARLAVLAGGTPPPGGRQRDYGQCAIVCDVDCERARPGWAYERFTPDGPIALLPRTRGWALVWTLPAARTEEFLGLDEASFAVRLRASFGERVGAFRVLGPRDSFPLALKYARNPTSGRVVRVGNAAQTLHPVAGQGFNLGLRDAFELAETVSRACESGRDPVDALARYRTARRIDRTGSVFFTDTLVRAFGNDHPVMSAARALGLGALDALPPVKRALMRRMIFGARG